ncbi:hypothetical protein KY092_18990 [Natronomonas gomsonensis]|uniref:hypothetical protein n=1 Tax=Natronomonas gomsonensis TaxID=1046043 RepID=UPI00227D262E|nr:hypothetical protein [Natronomonas gomsonensis]MCY4732629.1 hypothetical protein [Natronomonas gomsonensis]
MPDESYEVSATVENTGNHSDYATVLFTAGETTNNTTHVANETVYLSSGETATVTHEATADANATGTNRTWTVEDRFAPVHQLSFPCIGALYVYI